jgi:hypothetical protein
MRGPLCFQDRASNPSRELSAPESVASLQKVHEELDPPSKPDSDDLTPNFVHFGV